MIVFLFIYFLPIFISFHYFFFLSYKLNLMKTLTIIVRIRKESVLSTIASSPCHSFSSIGNGAMETTNEQFSQAG